MNPTNTETLRPAIFSGPMVKALLEGRKTMTRRLFRLQPEAAPFIDKEMTMEAFRKALDYAREMGYEAVGMEGPMKGMMIPPVSCNVGDIIYVREKATFWEDPDDTYAPQWWYAADNEDGGPIGLPPWKPSIHMPKEAARIFLRVVEIRVERLKDISPEDCIAEGIELCPPLDAKTRLFAPQEAIYRDYMDKIQESFDMTPYESFLSLWCSIHGADSWKSDPWVKVIRFERVGMQNPWRK